MLIRLDGAKNNRGLLGPDPVWLRKVGVKLWNGEDVGSLQEVSDMRDRRDEQMRMLAASAVDAMRKDSKGEMSIGDLASSICGKNALWEKDGVQAVKDVLQAMDAKTFAVALHPGTATFMVFRHNNSYRARIA